MATDQHIAAYQEAIAALKVQNAITDLARRYDTRMVVRVLRDWLDHMDSQIALIDGEAS